MFKIEGLRLVSLKVYRDERGFFVESFKKEDFETLFLQDNHSFSTKSVLRGMHFQKGQSKLIYVVEGEIFDVVVDIRKGSETFGKWEKVVLKGDEPRLFFIPDGFAHGFLSLSEKVHVIYKVSDYYTPAKEDGFIWNDPDVKIDWPIRKPILSKKDGGAKRFREVCGSG